MSYKEFAQLTINEKSAFVAKAKAAFNAKPGQKVYINLDQLRARRMFCQISREEYETRVFSYGPACYQFGELVR